MGKFATHNLTTVLVIDDDAQMCLFIPEALRDTGYTFLTAENGKQGFKLFVENQIDIVLLDLGLPDINGVELLRKFLSIHPGIPVVIISGYATIERAVETTKLGAYDFLEKPVNYQRLEIIIANALEKSNSLKIQQTLLEDMMARYEVIGVSETMKKLCSDASRIAKYDSPVIITGENGTGKERIASIIHQLSGRTPLVAVNCAAIPHELIESEFFGHKKGSFTGAASDKTGKFQLAHNGTLLLDEIGDMNIDMQAKILRTLETKEISMIGGNETVKVNVRFIALTNKNLADEIIKNNFREDLLYRLQGLSLHIPPLREHQEDIPPLATYFLNRHCRGNNIPEKRLTETSLSLLVQNEWKGNVRELKHFIETLAIFSDDEVIHHHEVQSMLLSFKNATISNLQQIKSGADPVSSLRVAIEAYEKKIIAEALKQANDNISVAAENLNIDRASLSKKIKRYNLKS